MKILEWLSQPFYIRIMCTVSFIQTSKEIIITSNRDEHISRELALMPKQYKLNDMNLYFPKDPKAGGTWFVINEIGNTLVLLNGAEKRHQSNPPYRKSRGLILLELASNINPLSVWNSIDLNNIEPFTIVAYINNKLFQLRWNSITKDKMEIDNQKYRIWSSTTLYDQEIVTARELWFKEYISNLSNELNDQDIFQFHTNTQIKDSQNGLIINRENNVLTKNVTQCIISQNAIKLIHVDLILNSKSEILVNK